MRCIVCRRKTTLIGFDELGHEMLIPRFGKKDAELVEPVLTVISDDAVESEFGWICSCGRWTKEDSDYHSIEVRRL